MRAGGVRRACEHMFVPRYTEAEARVAVASSLSYSAALRKLGLRPAGGNHKLFRRYVDEIWSISTDHFDAAKVRAQAFPHRPHVPLEEVLVEGSSYGRAPLKIRLYKEGLKLPECEMCGQGEIWHGQRISLILDHVNGVPDDNRLENLRIVCPNCNATLDTHCGRKNRAEDRECLRCGESFKPNRSSQRYCSAECGARHDNRVRRPRPDTRKVDRPSYLQLKRDLASMSMVAVGRKYGVSDNAVRKWIRWYEARVRAEGEEMAAT